MLNHLLRLQGWLEVEFPTSVAVRGIRLWTRVDCCREENVGLEFRVGHTQVLLTAPRMITHNTVRTQPSSS